MTQNERLERVLAYFEKSMPHVTTELDFQTPFQLVCATLLSAQCTDQRVNQVTPQLFAKFPTPQAMAQASTDEVTALVSSVSYPNAKARHLVEMAQMLVKDFQGQVPSDIEDLVRLPGVGRKTANVVRAVWFDLPAMPVDTHVFRVAHRLGLVSQQQRTPQAVEERLTRLIPQDKLSRAHHWLLLHGRYVCRSRTPLCEECPFTSFCPKKLTNSKLA